MDDLIVARALAAAPAGLSRFGEEMVAEAMAELGIDRQLYYQQSGSSRFPRG